MCFFFFSVKLGRHEHGRHHEEFESPYIFLKDSQESNDKCQQQRDSLAAQLQVVYEHKSRLEKTLQLETTDRKKAEDAVKTIRDQAERDRADARNEIKKLEKELEELKASLGYY
ncbi:hypothetical protein V5799_025696 [Amblyomma americanum]|uniref:Uncharacterized protein n=1 Tax=Amblyomma americanum TaxID=6943 RepID=A0AAQ4E8I8_AMBAM